MKIKTFCKVGLIVGLLLIAFGMTTYAASITSVSGTDGTNAFAATQEALGAYTPLDTTLSVSGTTDTGDVNVAILIEAEGTIVYVNQTVADSEGNFSFDFPVALQAGYVYVVKVNTENSATASKLYFHTEANEAPHYGDVDGDGAITLNDVSNINKYYGKAARISATVTTNINAGLADIDGDGGVTFNDISSISKYLGKAARLSNTVKNRLAWSEAK